MFYVDSHCHFDLCLEDGTANEENLLEGMIREGIAAALHITIDTTGYGWALDFARRHAGRGVLFSLGIHPSSKGGEQETSLLENFTEKVMGSGDSGLLFGIGETGLDFYRMRRSRDEQYRSFESQIILAKKWDLPLIVHSRDATTDSLALLKGYAPLKGIMHCFSEDAAGAKKFLDLGFHISFAGNVTYAKAHALHDSAAYVPAGKLLLETDAPFLTPVPLRGKKCRPYHVTHTYAFVAELRKTSTEKLKETIFKNYKALAPASRPAAKDITA